MKLVRMIKFSFKPTVELLLLLETVRQMNNDAIHIAPIAAEESLRHMEKPCQRLKACDLQSRYNVNRSQKVKTCERVNRTYFTVTDFARFRG